MLIDGHVCVNKGNVEVHASQVKQGSALSAGGSECPDRKAASILIFVWLGRVTSHPMSSYLAVLGVGKNLVLLLWVEEEGLHEEGNGILLEGGAFVGAEEEALLPVTKGRAHQDDLKHRM